MATERPTAGAPLVLDEDVHRRVVAFWRGRDLFLGLEATQPPEGAPAGTLKYYPVLLHLPPDFLRPLMAMLAEHADREE